jgi:hypothetical protein
VLNTLLSQAAAEVQALAAAAAVQVATGLLYRESLPAAEVRQKAHF